MAQELERNKRRVEGGEVTRDEAGALAGVASNVDCQHVYARRRARELESGYGRSSVAVATDGVESLKVVFCSERSARMKRFMQAVLVASLAFLGSTPSWAHYSSAAAASGVAAASGGGAVAAGSGVAAASSGGGGAVAAGSGAAAASGGGCCGFGGAVAVSTGVGVAIGGGGAAAAATGVGIALGI